MLTCTDQERVREEARANRFPHSGLVQCLTMGAMFAAGTARQNRQAGRERDPRYFQLGKGGFWHRTSYAVSRIFIARTDCGHNQFNHSEIFVLVQREMESWRAP